MRTTWLILVAVLGCKSKEPAKQEPAPKPGTPQLAAPGDAATPTLAVADAFSLGIDADVYASETSRLVDDAFGGKSPALPQLSGDGEVAAVDLSESIGLSDSSTYEIGFLGKKLDRVVLLDAKTASTIAAGQDPKLDRGKLKKTADSIKQRLQGFTPFGRVVDPESLNDAPPGSSPSSHSLVIGQAKLEWANSSGLKLTLSDATGKPVATESVAEVKSGSGAGECGGEPRLSGVWVDEPRKRVLLRVDYMVGGDECRELSGTYRMWKLP